MTQDTELTDEELHREAILARLAVLSAENRDRRRQEAMLNRVMQLHAKTLARQLKMPPPSRISRPLRRWVWRLKMIVTSLFYGPWPR